jgi:hypothetical protein
VLQEKNAVVLGVSPDGVTSHQSFREKFSLPFPLLVDEDKAISNLYGVWGERSFAGRTYMGVIRSHFVIDEHGEPGRSMACDPPTARAFDSAAVASLQGPELIFSSPVWSSEPPPPRFGDRQDRRRTRFRLNGTMHRAPGWWLLRLWN